MSDPLAAGKADVAEELEEPRLAGWPPRTFLDAVAAAFELAAALAFMAVILITLFQVVARYILHLPIAWTEEAARLLFVGSMMVGIAIATRHHENIVVDFLFATWRPRVKALAGLTFNIVILMFLAIWLRGAILLVGVNAKSTFVTIPWLRVSHFYGLEAVCIVLTAIFILADMRRQLDVLRLKG